MAGFKLNFANVTSSALPPGEYLCTLTAVKFTEASQSSGQPYIAAEFTVREDSDGSTQHAGRKLFRNFSLQPQSLFALKQAMIALDADPDIFEQEEDFDIVEYLKEELIGHEALLTVTNEDYQGEPRARVGRIRSPQGVGSF